MYFYWDVLRTSIYIIYNMYLLYTYTNDVFHVEWFCGTVQLASQCQGPGLCLLNRGEMGEKGSIESLQGNCVCWSRVGKMCMLEKGGENVLVGVGGGKCVCWRRVGKMCLLE